METNTYRPRTIGYVGIGSRQVSKTIREIETDNGEGTTLQIERSADLTKLCLTIIQYDTYKMEQLRTMTWSIDSRELCMNVSLFRPYHWLIEGRNNAILAIEKEQEDGDTYFRIYDGTTKPIITRLPIFSQICSGGRSDGFRLCLHDLSAQLIQDHHTKEGKSIPTYYEHFERLYGAIVPE